MSRRQTSLERLEAQAAAIQAALAAAQAQSGERRERWLDAVAQAVDAHRKDLAEEAARPVLTVLKGGALSALAVTAGAWARETWGAHRPITVGGLVVAVAVAAGVLVLGLWRGDGPGDGRPPVSAPTASAAPTVTYTVPPEDGRGASASASPSPTPSASGPGGSASSSVPVGVVPSPMLPITLGPSAPGTGAPGEPGEPGEPTSTGPAPSGTATTEPPDDGVPDGGEDGDGCLIDLPVPLVDVRVGELLCL